MAVHEEAEVQLDTFTVSPSSVSSAEILA